MQSYAILGGLFVMEDTKLQKLFFYTMMIIMILSIIIPGIHLISSKTPKAVNGILDLSHWDMNKYKTIPLDGQWEFYYGKLLTPDDFKNHEPEGKTIQNVPSKWSTYTIGNNILPSHGTTTYRLKILLPANNTDYGIKTTSIYMSSKIFVDGKQILTCGNPGDSPANTTHKFYADTAYFNTDQNEIEVIIQVANYISSYNGIYYKIYLGSEKSTTSLRLYNVFIDTSLIAGMFFISLYFFGLSFQRRNKLENIFFAAYCLFSAIYNSTCSEVLLNYAIPTLPYLASVKIEIVSLIFSLHFLFRYAYYAFKVTYSRRTNFLINGIVTFFVLLTCFTNYYLWHYTYLILCTGYIYIVCLTVYIFYTKLHKEVEGKYYLYTATISSIIFFILSLFNIVWAIESNIFIPVFQPIFILSLALFMSQKYENSYKTIEELSKRLSALDKLKDNFLANTSHELKTPLNGIINISQSLLDGVNGDLNISQRDDLQLITNIGKRLSILVYDILDYSKLKIMDITLKIRDIDLYQVAESTIDVFICLIKGKPLKIENKIPPGIYIVQADENRLKQIISNLLDNAIKFTPQGVITISSYLKEDFIFIQITDTGTGISQDKLKDIFNSYEQLDSASPDSIGTGLGLSIAKQLVELHKGKIFVESHIGKGSCFTFFLPQGKKEKITEIESIRIKGNINVLPLTNKNLCYKIKGESEFSILAVDDEYSNLKALMNTLSVCKYNITATVSSKYALQLLKTSLKYDLCIFDVMMPDISGYELCRKIREQYSPIELPVLLLTAKTLPEDLEAGFVSGANDFLTKPFEAGELKCRVKTLVELKKSKELLIEKETAFLQAQIRPHFLFNTLNTINSFCYTNPKKAAELIEELSVFLRSIVDFSGISSFISIEKELSIAKSYIEIQKARFGSKLQVEYNIDPLTLKYSILPLTIQPIVENSIKHGILKKTKTGKIILSLLLNDNHINIEIIDDGIGIPSHILNRITDLSYKNKGIGLTNINRRLLNFYNINLDISSELGKGTKIAFTIPAEYH